MVTRQDYAAQAVAAAQSVLLELVRTLGAFHEDIVLVGGYVPYLRFSMADDPHVGSMDIDLALNHTTLAEPAYASIQELSASRGLHPVLTAARNCEVLARLRCEAVSTACRRYPSLIWHLSSRSILPFLKPVRS